MQRTASSSRYVWIDFAKRLPALFSICFFQQVVFAETPPSVTCEIHFNGKWVDWCESPHLCATASGDFRFRYTTAQPKYVSVFIVIKNGLTVPVIPCVKDGSRFTNKKISEIVLDGSSIGTLLKTNGFSSLGQFAIVFVSDGDEVPNLQLRATEVARIDKCQSAITVPGFHVLIGSRVRRSVIAELDEDSSKAAKQHRELLNCYIDFNRRLFEKYEDVVSVIFGTLNPKYTEGFRDSSLQESRNQLRNSVSNLRTGNVQAAFDDADQAVKSARALFEETYGGRHAELAMALLQRGNMHFIKGDKRSALQDFEDAAGIVDSLIEVTPTFEVAFLQLSSRNSRAACYIDLAPQERAMSELDSGLQMAAVLADTNLFKVNVAHCKAALFASKSALLAEANRDEEALECLDELAQLVDMIREIDSHRAFRIEMVLLNHRGIIHLHNNEIQKAIECFDEVLQRCDQLGDQLSPIDIPNEAMSSLIWTHLQRGDYSAARKAGRTFLTMCNRIDGLDPQIELDCILSIHTIDESAAGEILGEDLHQSVRERLIKNVSRCDFREMRTLNLALQAAIGIRLVDPMAANGILKRIQISCQNNPVQSYAQHYYLARSLQQRAEIALAQDSRSEARLLANESLRITNSLLDNNVVRAELLSHLFELSMSYDILGEEDISSRLIRAAFRHYPDWVRSIPNATSPSILLEHAYRRWRAGEQVEWPLDEILYQGLDYGLMLHAAGDEIEGVDWCRKQRKVAAMLIEGVQRGRIDPQGCYAVCSIRKGLATTGMRLRRSKQTDDAGNRLRSQIILEKRRMAADAADWLFSSNPQPTLPQRRSPNMPLAWSLTLDDAVKDAARKWLTTSTQTSEALRPNEAIIDLFRIPALKEDRGNIVESDMINYAFILQRDRSLHVVQLGDAQKISDAIELWRERVMAGQDHSQVSQQLSDLVWKPIAAHLTPDIERLYICPDGDLGRIPWSALPSPKPNSILLDEFTIAVIPYGSYLYDQRQRSQTSAIDAERCLLVGDVDYDAAIHARDDSPSPRKVHWSPLKFSASELDEIEAVLEQRTRVRLTKDQATTNRVLQEIQTAPWVHFATHSYYVRPAVSGTDVAPSFLLRHPLLNTGVVLAGANNSPPPLAAGVPAFDEGGILSGEVIKDLHLDQVSMVVLSGCDSGLGVQSGSDGSVGLQRAFHLAGARNVVATLWHVEDRTTAALMKLFYYYCFVEQLAPVDALRRAQLALRDQPDAVTDLSGLRGPDFSKAARRLDADRSGAARRQGDPRLWAGFVFSGTGE